MTVEELYAKMLARLAVNNQAARNSAAFLQLKDTPQMRKAHLQNMIDDFKAAA
jgi:hypothetical protein